MSTNSTGMDPMTMIMLMQAMNSAGNSNSGGGQQYGTPPQNGGMGGVSQTTQASPLASGSNALAGSIRQRALSQALKKYMGNGASANFDATGLGAGGMPAGWGTATASQISDPVAAAGGYTDGLASFGAGGAGDALAGAGGAALAGGAGDALATAAPEILSGLGDWLAGSGVVDALPAIAAMA